jgi:hypothetical protein
MAGESGERYGYSGTVEERHQRLSVAMWLSSSARNMLTLKYGENTCLCAYVFASVHAFLVITETPNH